MFGAATIAQNLNGPYLLSRTPGAKPGPTPPFVQSYAGYPRPVEFFDIRSPNITTRYSQCFWDGLEPVNLPADVVARYAGKGMAIVGFEMDQVRETADGDVSVPITVAYNHHFEATIIGEAARFRKATPEELSGMGGHGGGRPHSRHVVEEVDTVGSLPSSVAIGGANGGE